MEENMEKIKKINENERIEGSESSHVILYSDDYDGLENSIFNTKVCMLTFWNGVIYFPGGVLEDKNETFKDNIISYVKELLDFDISNYKKDMVHISSNYISNKNHASHTYALKLKKMEMAKLQLKNLSFDENGEPLNQSPILLDTCGISKFNVNDQTLNIVLKSNFEDGVKEDFSHFVNGYIKPKIKKQQEFIDKIKNQNEISYITKKVDQNYDEMFNGLYNILKEKKLEYLLNTDDPRHKLLVDEKGEFIVGVLENIFDNDFDFLSGTSEDSNGKKKISFDFRQKPF